MTQTKPTEARLLTADDLPDLFAVDVVTHTKPQIDKQDNTTQQMAAHTAPMPTGFDDYFVVESR